MVQGSKADLLQLVVAWVAIVALLTWASYFVLWTSPHDQGSMTNSVIENVNRWTCCANGTVITPGSEVQYIIVIQRQVPASTGFCGGCPLPNGKGYVYGPTELRPNNPTISSFELNYAVFTFTFCPKLTTGCALGFGYPQPNQAAPNSWLSGPQGNISQFIITQKHDPLLSGIFQNPLFTVIVEMDTAGNYTLHYHNYFSTNATGTVAVGFSTVVFSRPYLYTGATTIAIAIVFAALTASFRGRGSVVARQLRPRSPREEKLATIDLCGTRWSGTKSLKKALIEKLEKSKTPIAPGKESLD